MATPIEYIGKRESYVENTYGSGINFHRGMVVPVADDLAKKLLQHKDVYRVGDTSKTLPLEQEITAPKAKSDDEERIQEMCGIIRDMDAEAVCERAMADYGRKLDKRKKVETLREELTALINQYGLID